MNTTNRTVAAIDCGTNSIRLLVSDMTDGKPTDLARLMRIVRLGEGIDSAGVITEAALERTATALREYANVLEQNPPQAVRMVATSASRDARNADEFTKMVVDLIGVEPEVITGDEEAQLSFEGAVADLPADDTQRLVVDIGGGSTEFVRGTTHAESFRSVNIGCVRMTERHLRDDPPTPEQVEAATAQIIGDVDAALATVDPDRSCRSLVGLAGSVTTVAGLALGLPEYDPVAIHHARLSYDEVAQVTATLLRQTRQQRLESPVMHPGRADVIAGGALVLRTIMERSGIDSVLASEHDILDGIAARLRR